MPLFPIVELIFLVNSSRYTWIERDNYHTLGQITKVLQSPQNVDVKALPPNPKSMQLRRVTWPCAVCCDVISLRAGGGRPEKRVAEDYRG
jgi:hypothetical protein